jgi:hypothetical protein
MFSVSGDLAVVGDVGAVSENPTPTAMATAIVIQR